MRVRIFPQRGEIDQKWPLGGLKINFAARGFIPFEFSALPEAIFDRFCCFSGLPTRGIRDEMSLFRLMISSYSNPGFINIPNDSLELHPNSADIVFRRWRSPRYDFPIGCVENNVEGTVILFVMGNRLSKSIKLRAILCELNFYPPKDKQWGKWKVPSKTDPSFQ